MKWSYKAYSHGICADLPVEPGGRGAEPGRTFRYGHCAGERVSSSAHFTKQFREAVGMSPTDFRRKMREVEAQDGTDF